MPAKKTTPPEASETTETTETPRRNAQGIPLGRPAFGPEIVSPTLDPARPAGGLAMQIPHDQQTPVAPGSRTLTMMNPTPIAAAADAPTTSTTRTTRTTPRPSTAKRG